MGNHSLNISIEVLLRHVEDSEDNEKSLIVLRETLIEMGLDLDNPTTLLSKINLAPLSSRTKNVLRVNGHLYVFSLIFFSEAELLRYVDFGRGALNEVKQLLDNLGTYVGHGSYLKESSHRF